MSRELETLLEQALALPEDARTLLAHRLLDSLDPTEEEGSESAWLAEAERRGSELTNGAVQPVEWDEAKTRLRLIVGAQQ